MRGSKESSSAPTLRTRPRWSSQSQTAGTGKQHIARESEASSRHASSIVGRSQGSSDAFSQAPDETAIPRERVHVPHKSIVIGGVTFLLENEDDIFYLRHPRWSLVGSGPSMSAAVKDLVNEAGDLRHTLARIPAKRLDADAAQLLQFLLRI